VSLLTAIDFTASKYVVGVGLWGWGEGGREGGREEGVFVRAGLVVL